MKAGYDDDESLQPHSHTDDEGDEHQPHGVPADPFGPEKLRYGDIAEDEGPVEAAILAEHPVLHHEPLVHAGAVPGDELLHEIAVGDNEPRSQHHLGHVFQVPQGDEILQSVQTTDGNQQKQDHGKAGVDGKAALEELRSIARSY